MTAPVRVVFLDHCAELSGGEIALLRMVQALGDDVEAHVLLAEDGPLVARLEAAGARVEVLPLGDAVRSVSRHEATSSVRSLGSALTLLRYVAALTRRLREIRPDVVHTNSLKSSLYGGLAARLAGRPVLWHVRDRISEDYMPRPAVLLVRTLSRVLPSAVLVNSNDTSTTVPRRSTVMYDVVDFGAPRAPEPLDDRPLRVGVVGRLAPWKGQDVFLEAFSRIAPGRRVVARLVGSAMFGEEAFEAALHAQVADLGLGELVEFRGFREDVAAEFAELDVVVHSSTTPEPFGQVVIEALAAGRPVVAAAAGGPAEILTDGVDGLLVAPGDVDGYAAAMAALVDDPALRERLVHAGLQRSHDFRPDAVSRQVLDVYGALAPA